MAASDSLQEVEDENPFAEEQIPTWWDQITVRGLVVSAVLGAVCCIISLKLLLTVGISPSLNVAAGLLGYFLVKSWIVVLTRLGIWSRPFTRQENTVIQTTVVACYGIAISGGFAAHLFALDEKIYRVVGVDYPGNREEDTKNFALSWTIPFLLLGSLIGVTVLVPLRKVVILKYKLVYPSGTATAMLINTFHTPKGAEVARKQVYSLLKYSSFSFLWNLFSWFFSGAGGECGFKNFPIFGFKAFKNTIYFDFNAAYAGTGMICSHLTNCSMLLGAIFSWGVLWPLISKQEGVWYPAGLDRGDFKGLYGYKVFVAIALILGDGIYTAGKIVVISLRARTEPEEAATPQEELQNKVFLNEGVPTWLAAALYVLLATLCMCVLPQLFPVVQWYQVLVSYLVAPFLAFCNAYGTGLTNWNMSGNYAKMAIFIFAAWGGSNGGVVTGLVACGVMFCVLFSASDLMQDFRTGYLTLSSPRSMFVSQLIGTTMGCVIAPLCFWIFCMAFDVGNQEAEYKAPYAVIYRAMAILGVQGISARPAHCLELSCGFLIFAMALNVVRDLLPPLYSHFVPVAMAMAIPFYIGAYVAVDVFVGTAVRFIWGLLNKEEMEVHCSALASGLICGDGIWTIPAAILSLAAVYPPICLSFSPSSW